MFSEQQAIHGVIVPVKTHLAADGYDDGSKTTGVGIVKCREQGKALIDGFWTCCRQSFHNRALGSRIRLDANAIIDG